MNSNGRCCVFQPFDKGPHDKRYEDTVAPAIIAAELEPYRVDRDDGAVIPIETLHDEIRAATICLADITTRNPNVMYELGYAIASGKDVVLICSVQATAFPFDIQHRGIVQYALDSASDFDQLRKAITSRIKSLLKRQAATQEIVSVSPVKSTHGLQPNEISALALVMANVDSSADRIRAYTIKEDMQKAGYTKLATQLALTRLSRMQFVEAVGDSDFSGNDFVSYQILEQGEDWLLENQEKLELRRVSRIGARSKEEPFQGITVDDVPF
jgi:nucleoside 2-deoxyribosyltransferase